MKKVQFWYSLCSKLTIKIGKEAENMNQHEISEYIENLPLQKTLCKGYRPDDVYEVICNLSSMYNQLLSETLMENEELKIKIANMPQIAVQQEMAVAFGTEEIEETIEETIETQEAEEISEEKPAENRAETVVDKSLQKLKRAELLELLLEQSRNNDSLKIQLEEKAGVIGELKKQLKDRKIDIQSAGTIAEASFKLNGVYDAAEKAAQQYLENLQELYRKEQELYSVKEAAVENRCSALLQATNERCEFMKEDTQKKCDELMTTTMQKCEERERESEERCRMLDSKAKADVDNRWNELSRRLEEFYASHAGIRELLAASGKI